jgi:hypothetical protein
MNDDFDFGFTAVEFDPTALDTAQSNLKNKLLEVEGLILPLLQNLKKNPDKAYIHWPNRTEIIDKQIAKITAITRSES